MSIEVKLRRGTTTEHSTFVGAEAEVTVDTTKKTVVVHDGATAGGIPLAKESDIPEVPTLNERVMDPFKQGTHSGLTFAYEIGIVRKDNVVTRVDAGNVTLADDATNYVQTDEEGAVSANTTGYTTGKIPLYMVVTASGAISSVQDDRCFFNQGGGDNGSSFWEPIGGSEIVSSSSLNLTITAYSYPA